jgi:TRAP-type C4-dicarboxylate transport system substrate-binding protein
MRRLTAHPLAAGAVVGALALSWCVVPGVVMPGNDDAVVLRLATIDESVNPTGQNVAQQVFVDSLGEVSGGQITVKLTTNYGDGGVTGESDLVKAIARGDLDGGWPASRAFWRAGIRGLEALEAPMMITSEAAEKAVVSGPISDTIFSRLRGTGIVGVGLGVGPLRRPFASGEPLLGPDEWHRARFRVFNSPVQADAVRSFGGTPVSAGVDWTDRMLIDALEGGEFDIAEAFATGAAGAFSTVTGNVVLWPKIAVFSVSQKRFDALTAQQRGWIRAAADRAVLASLKVDYDESAAAQALCAEGVRFVDASEAQIAALRQNAGSVMDQLAVDNGADSLFELRELAARFPAPDVPEVSAECRQPRSDRDSVAVGLGVNSGVPDGVYRAGVAASEMHRAGISAVQSGSAVWTLNIRGGTYRISCRPTGAGSDCGGPGSQGQVPSDHVVNAGVLRGIGQTVFFMSDATRLASFSGCEAPCVSVPTYRVTWSMRGNQLHFEDPIGGPKATQLIKNWVKVG